MRPEDLREFALRSREPVARSKRAFWERAEGLSAFDAGQALYEHAKAVGNFPTAEQRAADFAHHVKLKELLTRASQALTSRAATG